MGALVDRPRLLAGADVDATMDIVTGPSGIGKTVYALQASSDRGGRTAWIRCAPGTASATDVVALAHRSVGQDFEASSHDPLRLAGDLLALLEAEPTVLVVDEYEAADRDVDALLAETVALLDPISSVIVATRVRPAGLIGRVRRLVHVVDADELRFRHDEVRRLFAHHDLPAEQIDAWLDHTGGWAVALDLATGELPGDRDAQTVLAELVRSRAGDVWPDIVRFAACPYLTGEVAAAVGIVDLERLRKVLPVSEVAGRLSVPAAVREAVVSTAKPDVVERARRRAFDELRESDPVAAIELAVELGELDTAAGLLHQHVGSISADAAMSWVYRFPPSLRHRLPPAVTGGRATVNPGLAELEASERLELAESDEDWASAGYALASVRAAQADLDDAAQLLEQVLARAGQPTLRASALRLQTLVRWWQGDLGGARSAASLAPESAWSAYVDAMIALAEHDDERAATSARRSVELAGGNAVVAAPGRGVEALLVAIAGDRLTAIQIAEDAWQAAFDHGGFELGAAGVPVVWLLATSDADRADARAREVEARVGPRDAYARAAIAIARAHLAVHDPDDGGRSARRLRAIRAAGFGSVEAVFARLDARDSSFGSGLHVALLGDGVIQVDGHAREPAAFKSRKAVEVVRYLADRGSPCRRTEVIEAIWPDRAPDKGRALLRTALSEVRAGLEPDRRAGQESRFLVADREVVRLDAQTDLDDASSAEAGEALRLLRFDVVPDLDADWADDVRRRRDRLLAESADRVRRDDAHPDRRLALEVMMELEPWNRSVVDELMELLRAAGDEAGAASVDRRWFEDD